MHAAKVATILTDFWAGAISLLHGDRLFHLGGSLARSSCSPGNGVWMGLGTCTVLALRQAILQHF
jgi:hypothetical protein